MKGTQYFGKYRVERSCGDREPNSWSVWKWFLWEDKGNFYQYVDSFKQYPEAARKACWLVLEELDSWEVEA